MSTLVITLTRTELELDDLVLSGSIDENPIGVNNYVEPQRQARIRYAPSSDMVDGDEQLAVTKAQTFHQFNAFTDQADTEAESREKLAELWAAIGQFSYTTTVEIDGAPPEAWSCVTGSATPAGARTLLDLEYHNPVWSVQIPCKPTPTIGA